MPSQILEKPSITDKDLAAITNLPMKLFYPHRILILQILRSRKEVRFTEFTRELKISRGRLWSHIRALMSEELLDIQKEIHGRKVKTTYTITQKGIKTFDDFCDCMRKIVNKL